MNKLFRNTSLGQQLALVAAVLCLLVSLALVMLGALSSRYMQLQLLEEQGSALAELVARAVSPAMENGDLLSVSASLQRFIATSAAAAVEVTDVDGKAVGQAGRADGQHLRRYSAPVLIGSNTAGRVTVVIDTLSARAALMRLILSLLGLAVLLSLTVYAASRRAGQSLATRLLNLANTIRLDGEDSGQHSANELLQLTHNIEALPMDLLRTRSEPEASDESYRTTAVLYLHLASLADYVDTLNEQALRNYTDRVHQMVYAAAGFYAGELQVARQFGLAVYFSGDNKAGSAAFRAASCAWLVRAVSNELERRLSRSMTIAMAIAQSELGIGDGADIYPGLYMQATLDELEAVCADAPANLLLSPSVCEDIDIASRLRYRANDDNGYAVIDEFAGGFRDLLERQLQLILRHLADDTADAR